MSSLSKLETVLFVYCREAKGHWISVVAETVLLLPSSLSEVSINLGGGVCCLTFDLLYWL